MNIEKAIRESESVTEKLISNQDEKKQAEMKQAEMKQAEMKQAEPKAENDRTNRDEEKTKVGEPERAKYERSNVIINLFEYTNTIGCVIFPLVLVFNVGGLFFPGFREIYTASDMMVYIKHMVVALAIFCFFVVIPLLLLFVDCFVIMRGVEGFKVSALSILMMPASYPMVRTNALEEPSKVRKRHIAFGSGVFVCNLVLVAGIVIYFIRLIICISRMAG